MNGERKLACEGADDVLLEFRLNGIEPVTLGYIHMHAQDAFLFAARYSEDLMRLEAVYATFKFIIGFVHSFFVHRIGNLFNAHLGKLKRFLASGSANIGVVAYDFSHDVACALQGFFDAENLIVEEFLCQFFRRAAGGLFEN